MYVYVCVCMYVLLLFKQPRLVPGFRKDLPSEYYSLTPFTCDVAQGNGTFWNFSSFFLSVIKLCGGNTVWGWVNQSARCIQCSNLLVLPDRYLVPIINVWWPYYFKFPTSNFLGTIYVREAPLSRVTLTFTAVPVTGPYFLVGVTLYHVSFLSTLYSIFSWR